MINANEDTLGPIWFQRGEEKNAQRHNDICRMFDQLNIANQTRDKLFAVTDEAEILVCGLPNTFQGSLFDASKLVLTALGFGKNHDLPPVLYTRDWSPSENLKSTNANTTSNSFKTKAFVFFAGSAALRDQIIKKSPSLASATAEKVFGSGGDTKVYLRALWPKPVFDLLSKAKTVSESLGYARPKVMNLRVFVRQTTHSDPIPIISEEDLLKLQPNPHKPPKHRSTNQTSTLIYNKRFSNNNQNKKLNIPASSGIFNQALQTPHFTNNFSISSHQIPLAV